jgi:hypothetical protein
MATGTVFGTEMETDPEPTVAPWAFVTTAPPALSELSWNWPVTAPVLQAACNEPETVVAGVFTVPVIEAADGRDAPTLTSAAA